jgi:hypothetical protein
MIDPDALDGELFLVDSFFNVFVDITVTDVDSRPGRDYPGQPDGAAMTLQDNGPTRISLFYERLFDKDAPDFGLFPPPETDPWIGMFELEISLDVDINGNGEDDKIKITLEFDAGAFVEGDVVDESTDPPFMIGAQLPNGLPDPSAFGGPATTTSDLQNPVLPEPATMTMLALGGLAILRRRRNRG